MNSIESHTLITEDLLELSGALLAIHEFLNYHGLTERPAQGKILVHSGDIVKIITISHDGIFEEVVSSKQAITLREGGVESTSGDARNNSVDLRIGDYLFKGYFYEDGLGVGYSGAEEDLDEFYARSVHAFMMALVSMFKKVMIPAKSIKQVGDSLKSWDVAGQAQLASLPAAVQGLFPYEVENMDEPVRIAVEHMLAAA